MHQPENIPNPYPLPVMMRLALMKETVLADFPLSRLQLDLQFYLTW